MQDANKIMTVYAAKCTGNATNCLYPTKVNLTDEEIARRAFSRDTVFAEYKDNYRANDNFIRSNVIPFDCDNDHSDDPSEWITEKDIAEVFDGVCYIVHYDPTQLILYHTSVSLIERLIKRGLLTASDYKKAIDVLNKKYGISSDSIFAEIA